jgi:hypothetical protein
MYSDRSRHTILYTPMRLGTHSKTDRGCWPKKPRSSWCHASCWQEWSRSGVLAVSTGWAVTCIGSICVTATQNLVAKLEGASRLVGWVALKCALEDTHIRRWRLEPPRQTTRWNNLPTHKLDLHHQSEPRYQKATPKPIKQVYWILKLFWIS